MSPALGPNQAPTQYVWRAIYRGLKWPGLRKHLRSHLTAKNTKILMYKVLIRPVLTYASVDIPLPLMEKLKPYTLHYVC